MNTEPREQSAASSAFDEALLDRLRGLGIAEEDLEEEFIKGSGPGGQKINKSSTCVQLTHKPSGTVVKCQRERSRHLNRAAARAILCEQLERAALAAKQAQRAARARARYRAKVRKRRGALKERVLADKKHRSKVKALRRRPNRDFG